MNGVSQNTHRFPPSPQNNPYFHSSLSRASRVRSCVIHLHLSFASMIRQYIAHFFHVPTLLSHIICILKEQQYSYIKKRQSTQPCLFFTHLRKWLYVYRTPSYKKPGRHFLNIRYHINPFISSFTHSQDEVNLSLFLFCSHDIIELGKQPCSRCGLISLFEGR